jgi:hypothetical protein
LIVLCILLNIILGGEADLFISTVAKNAMNFLQSLPPGVLPGVALIVMIYGFLKARLQPRVHPIRQPCSKNGSASSAVCYR